MTTDLSSYNNDWYNPGSPVKRLCWYFVNVFFFKNTLNPSSSLKVLLLKLFGAKVGRGVMIKPGVNIKYPWMLKIGDHSWVGENVWIDNLAEVSIGSNVCISQGALLLSGNHDYKKTSFDLITKPIVIENGVWIGAKAVVCPGVRCHSHSVLSVQSVATRDLEEYQVYRGNPAQPVRKRMISE
ncbi:WcaF family extracellular polysaccharide biosynthesis acetyltransferase [Balneola sp. MJW-20]|uniref:WcaF family extracellular polysaccharide biosynthesis acetyltransferase n=1 Tax=Gracilimonas aurantiaca TaxID=3234185 RepID=UPI0034668552